MKKRLIALLISLVMTFAFLAACAEAPADPPPPSTPEPTAPADPATPDDPPAPPADPVGVTLDIWTNMTGVANDTFAEVCQMFTNETGIDIDYAAPANDYEGLMRTKMATNDMPDVFSTHGWAVIRYGTFLRPLNDQPWFGRVSPQIGPVVSDDNGNMLAFAVDIDIAGMNYNRDILAEVGVDVASIITWSDFEDVCELVKAAGYIPIFLGGIDDWTIGQFFDWVAPSLYITNESNNHRNALLNGSFDWQLWGQIADMFADWNRRGFFNEDCTTADYDTTTLLLGQGEVAFTFFGNYAAMDAASKGSANIGMMPIPAYLPGDTPTLIAGERLALGVWKDSPNEAEALLFLEFLAREDIMVMLAEANGAPAGFSGVQTDLGFLTGDFATWANIRTFPYFDRVFLPSGMWNDLCDTGLGILNGTMSTQAVIDHMESSYNTLRAQ